jgi:hypothetical protein
MRRYVVRVTGRGDLAYYRRDSLGGWKILVIKAKRAERGDISTPIIELASLTMLPNQAPYFLLMAGKVIIFLTPKLLLFEKRLANTAL